MAVCFALAACSGSTTESNGYAAVTDDASYQGVWILVDTDSQGARVYVDRDEIYPTGQDRKRTDIGIVDGSGRMVERAVFDCRTRSLVDVTGQVGQASFTQSLVGDLPHEHLHLSAIDFICEGRRSEPEARVSAVPELPAHL